MKTRNTKKRNTDIFIKDCIDIKRKFCSDNNINLIEVKYNDN